MRTIAIIAALLALVQPPNLEAKKYLSSKVLRLKWSAVDAVFLFKGRAKLPVNTKLLCYLTLNKFIAGSSLRYVKANKQSRRCKIREPLISYWSLAQSNSLGVRARNNRD